MYTEAKVGEVVKFAGWVGFDPKKEPLDEGETQKERDNLIKAYTPGAEITIVSIIEEAKGEEGSDDYEAPQYASKVFIGDALVESSVFAEEIEKIEEKVAEKKKATKQVSKVKPEKKKATEAKENVTDGESKKKAVNKKPSKKSSKKTVKKDDNETTINTGLKDAVEKVLSSYDGNDLSAAKGLAGAVQENYYVLGMLMLNIYESGSFGELGYDNSVDARGNKPGFKAYVENELPITYRKAMDLKAIARAFSPLSDEAIKRLMKIGWAKASKLQNVVSDDNVEEIIMYCEEKDDDGNLIHNRDELVEHIREEYKDKTGGTTPTDTTPTDTGEVKGPGVSASNTTLINISMFDDEKLMWDSIRNAIAKEEGLVNPSDTEIFRAVLYKMTVHMGIGDSEAVREMKVSDKDEEKAVA